MWTSILGPNITRVADLTPYVCSTGQVTRGYGY